MAGKGRPPQALTKARKAAREGNAEAYSYALLEHMIDCEREGKEGIIEGKDAISLLKTLIISNRQSKTVEEDTQDTELSAWLKEGKGKEKTL